jgi:hypothetical protein
MTIIILINFINMPLRSKFAAFKEKQMKHVLLSSLLTFSITPFANASPKIIECQSRIPHGQAKVVIEVISAQNHSELAIWRLKLTSGSDSLVADMTVHLGDRDSVIARGTLFSDDINNPIEPNDITIQGYLTGLDGEGALLSLYDENRILQKGYGLHMRCKAE